MTAAEPDLSPGVPRKLDRYVTRLVAPNPGIMTGPGTNTYLVGEQQLAVIDPGPADAAHLEAIQATGAKIAAMTKAAGVPGGEHNVRLVLDQPLTEVDTVELEGLSLRAVHTP